MLKSPENSITCLLKVSSQPVSSTTLHFLWSSGGAWTWTRRQGDWTRNVGRLVKGPQTQKLIIWGSERSVEGSKQCAVLSCARWRGSLLAGLDGTSPAKECHNNGLMIQILPVTGPDTITTHAGAILPSPASSPSRGQLWNLMGHGQQIKSSGYFRPKTEEENCCSITTHQPWICVI